MTLFHSFLLTFIPLFVAIDVFGTIPYYISLSDGRTAEHKRNMAMQAVATALVTGIVFTLAGKLILRVLGITPSDFRIAGGLLLIIFSIQELFGRQTKTQLGDPSDTFLGVVPLGIPVIAGPAVMTTLLILSDQYSFFMIILSLSLNLVITLVLYLFSEIIVGKLGEASSRVSAKLFAIFLAAIGVMMIRRGLETILLR